MKTRVETLMETPHNTISQVTATVPAAVKGALPSVAAMKKMIQRKRNVGMGALAVPTSLLDLVIPQQHTLTSTGELFLKFDSGPSATRFIIFTTERNLRLMAECQHWYADGTFKTAPPHFEQLYTIHEVRFNNFIPSVYALLPKKDQPTYERLLEALKGLKDDLLPDSIMTDFEQATINAFRKSFPNIQNRGCFFHFLQSLWRHIQENNDIRSKYVNPEDPEFAINLRKLAALAFVPAADVPDAFEELISTQFFDQNEKILKPFVDYFEDTYIGRLRTRGIRRNPSFAINLWNQYDATMQGLPKTNNSIEGWHRKFSSSLSSHHPSIWKFIDALKKEQSINELQIEQFIAGNNLQAGRQIYRNTANNILIIVKDYGNRDPNDYLRGIAYNFQLQADY